MKKERKKEKRKKENFKRIALSLSITYYEQKNSSTHANLVNQESQYLTFNG